LILLIIINILYILSVLEAVKIGSYGFILNFSLIPVAIAAAFLSGYEVLILAALSFALAASLIFVGASLIGTIQTALLLVMGAAFVYYLRYMTEHMLETKEKVLEVIREEHRSSHEFNKKAQNDKISLEKSVYDISSLYQAPKKMISSTTLEELLECLRNSMEGYFTFTNCKLLIFSFKDEEARIESIHNIPEKKNKDDIQSGYEDHIVELMKGRKSPLVIDRNSGVTGQEDVRLPEYIETFIAVPLTVGNRFNGIFCVEGVAGDDILRFMILAHQFAMVLERIRLYELVQELAITDGLTDVFVRRYFLERLDEETERAKYFNTRLSFLMIDIDHFKRCNDKYGHLVGDVVLKETAGILKKSLRDIDIIGRYGGEEFSIMLPETPKDGALIVGERLRKAVEAHNIKAYDEAVNLSISIGIATFPDDTDEISKLIDMSDQMLYKAKEGGRNKVEIYG